MVVPRPVHGNQRLLSHRLEVSQSRLRKRMREDRFGNVVFGISIAKVEEAVDFDVSLIAEHLTGRRPHLEASPGRRQMSIANAARSVAPRTERATAALAETELRRAARRVGQPLPTEAMGWRKVGTVRVID